jgi:photosystem II stability/assembly factor-like uncharacterized protein
MRHFTAALLVSVTVAFSAQAADLRFFDDAALHAVQFIDREEGWAVGDEGVVWHTIDGGKNWERQPTGVRASLMSLHFLNPYTGWIAGREELPYGKGSVGVLLFTRDGGLKWERVTLNALPGLNRIKFVDNRTGYAAGDGTEQYPTGVFCTTDSGRTWNPLPGARATTWLAADFSFAPTGPKYGAVAAALGGAWNRLGIVSMGTDTGKVSLNNEDTLGGRAIRGLQCKENDVMAVGQGGLVLLSDKTNGRSWQVVPLKLPPEVLACWDFHAVQWLDNDIWVVGRPGSVVLHGRDRGDKWEVLPTNQPLPLNSVFFADGQRGWAVGEFGTILATKDGGKSWQVQHRGGQQAAAMCIHAQAQGLPAESVALLGGEDGYLSTGLRVLATDPASALPERAAEPARYAAAVRQAAGASGEVLWQFPMPAHLSGTDKTAYLQTWDRLHAGRGTEQLLRQLVLALRIWRPQVVLTDPPQGQTAGPEEALISEAVLEAYRRAGDPKAFPEQMDHLGLKPWQPAKVYARVADRTAAQATVDLHAIRNQLETTLRDFAMPALALVDDTPATLPPLRCYRLLASRLDGAANHGNLMDGVSLAPNGVARRALSPGAELAPEIAQTIRSRRALQTLSETPAGQLTDPNKLLAQIGPLLSKMSDDQAAQAAFAVAMQYARQGQYPLAREAFLLMVDRYPAHSLSADAYRWLIRHNSSSEARRRHELGQFLVITNTEFSASGTGQEESELTPDKRGAKPKQGPAETAVELKHQQQLRLLGSLGETRRWYQGCLEVEPRLAAFGPLFATDPEVQFCLQSARRNLGDFDGAKKWYTEFAGHRQDGPWRDAALAELWLAVRSGPPPKPIAQCRQTPAKPFLDGNFDDDCWKGMKPLVLKNAIGDTDKDYPTEAWMAYDKEFLYLALRCKHPADKYVPAAKGRKRDEDLQAYDRVSLMLDLDRDYNSFFHFQVDQRGCVREECNVGGIADVSWNPRWFVAVKSDAEGWQIEAAIPMMELSGDAVTIGKAWACNVVRTLPGRGVQAWSTPADVKPRPEGMGLLIFTQGAKPEEK